MINFYKKLAFLVSCIIFLQFFEFLIDFTFGDKDGFLAECNQECPFYLQPLCTIIMVQKQVVKNTHKVLDGLNVHTTLKTTNNKDDTENYNNLRTLGMAIISNK